MSKYKQTLIWSLALLSSSLLTMYFTKTMTTQRCISRILHNGANIRPTVIHTAAFECPCWQDNDAKSPEQNMSRVNQTVPSSPKLASHLLKPQYGSSQVKHSILGNIWNFKELGDQLLYVYEQLLKKNWTENLTNINKFRQELASYRAELNDSSTIILHQKNIKVNGSIKLAYTRNSFTISPEIFKLLPKNDPIGLAPGKRFPSCAVVGNSGSILHSGCGENIDKSDFVIRCNLAPLHPFKQDAGMKSNYMTMNPSLLHKKYGMLRNAASVEKFNEDIASYDGPIIIPCFGGSYTSRSIMAIKAFKGKKPMMVCMNTKHYQSVIDFWGKTGAIKKKMSTGFYLVSMAIQICDHVELYMASGHFHRALEPITKTYRITISTTYHQVKFPMHMK